MSFTSLARKFHTDPALACESLMYTASGLNYSSSGMKHTAVVAIHRLPCLNHAARRLATNQCEILGLATTFHDDGDEEAADRLATNQDEIVPLKPALFFDRDGTLMKEVDHCHEPEKVEAMEGLLSGLARAHEAGWYNVMITNQSGIGRGYFTEKEFEAVQEELQRQLQGHIDASYMSPDLPNTGSLRRKPAPGMLLEAAQDLGIDLAASFMIGDRASDIEAGRAAGCQTILVLTGYGKEHLQCGADFTVPTVCEAIEVALRGTVNPKV